MPAPHKHEYLFGGDKPWNPLDWTSSDDRVRGGSSYSTLTCNAASPIARYHGNLDIKTLGGAGFASQRTTGDRTWDLSAFSGLVLDIAKSDGMQYTLTLKDELLPQSPDGREQSSVNWEYDFKAQKDGQKISLGWHDLKATYRGREKVDAKPLDLKNVKRISLLTRSFFGKQEGDFSLSIVSIAAVEKDPSTNITPYRDDPNEAVRGFNDEKVPYDPSPPKQSWLGWIWQCVL
ncbi:hypothetical protein HYFRA_00004926 [Hymenoscyphus fraxineus]|uniref:NADH:ubiquinone oxidoreductase intermediate-associated protein 30 domain-containing protein n=1 Tax=Hymenoscyphus fraxineus TaxID=746836 RepID=A0A9N9KLQ7_9HELO|nr:hypothetical protein HYFRA_00004926 [Hymenoscyphus fraxineus]